MGMLEQMAKALEDMQKVIDMLMPGIDNISCPDYALINEAPIRAKQVLATYAKIARSAFPLPPLPYTEEDAKKHDQISSMVGKIESGKLVVVEKSELENFIKSIAYLCDRYEGCDGCPCTICEQINFDFIPDTLDYLTEGED